MSFLRTQYPGSSLRVGALLAQGQIYENDLHDAAAARERYSLLLKQYPHSSQAEEAKAGIASLDRGGRAGGEKTAVRAADMKAANTKEQRAASTEQITPRSASETSDLKSARSTVLAPMAATGTAAADADASARRGTSVPVDAPSDDAAQVPSPVASQAQLTHVAKTASANGSAVWRR